MKVLVKNGPDDGTIIDIPIILNPGNVDAIKGGTILVDQVVMHETMGMIISRYTITLDRHAIWSLHEGVPVTVVYRGARKAQ